MTKLINKDVKVRCPVFFPVVHKAEVNPFDATGESHLRKITLALTNEQLDMLVSEGMPRQVYHVEEGVMKNRAKSFNEVSKGLQADASKLKDHVFLTIKNNYKTKEIADFSTIPVVDASGKKEFSESIGNNSECIVHIKLKQHKLKSGKPGPIHPRISGVQVIKHIPYVVPTTTTLEFDSFESEEESSSVSSESFEVDAGDF